ncbi:MAG: DUF6089 family protein [Bacteroidota bacterium]
MRRLLTLLTGVMMMLQVQAQQVDVGLFLGISNYQGDLQSKVLGGGENHIAYGVFGRYHMFDYLSFRAHVYKGALSGNDNLQAPESGRRRRNLSFRSDIMELGIQAEFNPLPLLFEESSIFAPYIFAGVSGFHYKPYAFFEGKWYELQPLGTEGQAEGEEYKLFQVAIPMGIGTNIKVSDYSSIGLEFGLRKTFTDYIDDVSGVYPDIDALSETDPLAAALSYRMPEYYGKDDLPNPAGNQRGSSNKDWYVFAGMTFSFNLAGLLSLGSGPGNYSPF